MFADPQTVTYNAVAKNLPAIARGDTQSVYQLNDAGVIYKFTIAHQFAKRNRVVVRLQRDVYAADPVVPAQNILASATGTLTLDFPQVGYVAADIQNLGNALVAWATSGNLLKVINGET